ncbi:MAG: PAS domain S-box protein, partial [Cyanobacteria bacterium J06639_1]
MPDRAILLAIFESLRDAALVTDARGQIARVNPAACALLGLSEAELRDRLVTQWIDLDIARAGMQTRSLQHPDGSIRQVEWQVIDREDSAQHLLLGRDVTERHQTEIRLERAQQRFELALHGSGNGLWDWDVQQNEVYLSPQFKAIMGYADAELPSTVEAWSSHLHPEEKERVLAAVQAHLERREPYDIEFRLRTKSGHYTWVRSQGQAEWDEAGRPLRMAGGLADIGYRKQVEVALRASENRFRALYNRTPIMLHSIDSEGRLIEVSDYWLDKLGYERQEVLGKKSTDFLTEASRHYAKTEVLPEYLKRGWCRDVPYQFVTKSGDTIDVLLSATSERDEAGHFVRSLAAIVDVTERKQAEAERDRQMQRSRLIAELALNIRRSLKLEDILRATAFEIQAVLDADRVAIARLDDKRDRKQGRVIEEAVRSGWPRLMGSRVSIEDDETFDLCLRSDLADPQAPACRVRCSRPSQARASICVPIPSAEGLWGLLLVQQCSSSRQWQSHELDLLQPLSDQLAIAVAHARLLEHLEEEVADRTTALVEANQHLQTEIRDRRRIEHSLRESREMLAGILENAEEAIISVDEGQIIQLFNRGAEKIFGYTPIEILGRPLGTLLPDRSRDRHEHFVRIFGQSAATSRGMADRSQNVAGLRKNGEIFPAEASISKLKLGDRVIYTAILKDISEREAIDRMKNEFVSVVSHELRTPLTSVHGSLKLLSTGRLGNLDPQGRQLLDIAVSNTERLTRLINDVLDLERIESGRMPTQMDYCDAADTIAQAAEAMQAAANEREISLSLAVTSARMYADSDRILQTLMNLMDNAIKFSPLGGTVWVDVRERQDDVLFRVRDRGRGIPADKRESIFGRFQQVDASDSRAKGGTGLGLAICRQIIERHGGCIWVESELGRGSTFSFTIPKAPQTSSPRTTSD